MPSAHYCPHLGLHNDRTVSLAYADETHRCYASEAPGDIEIAHQQQFCLTPRHVDCPRYLTPPETVAQVPQPMPAEAKEEEPAGPPRPWWRPALWAVALILLVAVVWRYGSILLGPGGAPTETAVIRSTATFAPLPADTPFPSPVVTAALTESSPASRAVLPTATLTPWPDGRTVTLQPAAQAVGWVASNETRGNHFGDSFVHSGFQDGTIFHGALQFDLSADASAIAPGSELHAAALQLTGLSDERLGVGGSWEVVLLGQEADADWSQQTFQSLHNAPAIETLLPVLGSGEVAEGIENVLQFSDPQLDLLEQRLLSGAVSFRVDGPESGEANVFAWDSGYGPASRGEGPVLWISAGPPPSTPWPTATIEYVVVTSTPTPENVLTVAAALLTATSQAETVGTGTPMPAILATPTPLIVVTNTPRPLNVATAQARHDYATAVALTTGTFTPTPPNMVTATPPPPLVVVTPTPAAPDLASALQRAIAEATRVAVEGTPTSLPGHWVVAIVVTPTPRAANTATSTAIAARATIVALTSGTFTPTPFYVITATPTPTPTTLPILLYLDELTPTPSTTPTATPPSQVIPAVLHGKIAFWSDRSGQDEVYVVGPEGGRVALLTERWPYELALAREAVSPNGEQVVVRIAGQGIAQLFIVSNQAPARQLTFGNRISYDPAWSPRGDLITFVSQDPGNAEIFIIQPDGQGAQRLTSNQWEADQHPSWSPDGRQIVYGSDATGRRQIWIMNADGSGPRVLGDGQFNDWNPVWIK